MNARRRYRKVQRRERLHIKKGRVLERLRNTMMLTLHVSIEWLVLLVIVGVLLIRSSAVQTYFAKKVSDYFAKEWNTVVSIEKVDILFIDKVDVKGVLLLNQTKTDTIAAIQSLMVGIDGWKSFRNQLDVRSLKIENAIVKIIKERTTGQMNLQFIIDYFQTQSNNTDPIMPIAVKRLRLKNIRFHFDDEFLPPIDHQGMDYQHLHLSDIQLDARNVKMINGIITGQIVQLAAKEKCGIYLKKWTSPIVKVSAQGIDVENIEVATEHSTLKSKKFQLKYKQWTDFIDFVDSVAFDADIEQSAVSMIDIAVFAPPLLGMDQRFELKGKVSKFVKNLKVQDFEFTTGENTVLRGTINLPDFRHIQDAFYQQRIEYALIDMYDLKAIKLPQQSVSKSIEIDENVMRLGYIQASNVRLDGIFSQFVISSDEIYTQLGSIQMENGLLFTYKPESESFLFTRSNDSQYDIKVKQFHVGKFLNTSAIGFVDGAFFLSGEAVSFSDIAFHHIEGKVNQCDIADYSYANIAVKNAHFSNKILYAEVDVNDKNLQLNYQGTIDLNNSPTMDMTVDLKKALLGKLHLIENDSANIVATINVNTIGLNPNTMQGHAQVLELKYVQGEKHIDVPTIDLTVKRGLNNDTYHLKSSLLNAELIGKINDLSDIQIVVMQQLRQLFPGMMRHQAKKEMLTQPSEDCLEFDIEILKMQSFWDIFYPPLTIAPHTIIRGDYDASKHFFEMDIRSPKITHNTIELFEVQLYQVVDSTSIDAQYTATKVAITDSLTFEKIRFEGRGNGDHLKAQLTWNLHDENASKIEWITQITTPTRIDLKLKPSYFTVNEHKWIIEQEADLSIDTKIFEVNHLKLHSDSQFIAVNGKISTNDNDKLHVYLDEIDLQKISEMFGLNLTFEGKLNGWGYIVNPYENIRYMGDMKLQNLIINNEEVGDVYLMSQWNNQRKKVDVSGDFIYRNNLSCQFIGTYDVFSKTDNINFDVVFDHTDISFVSAFIDELVLDSLSGQINGKIAVSGSLARPIVNGKIDMEQVKARMVMLGTSFVLNGQMHADKDGFYVDYMPISDMEGNTGALTGAVFHTDYQKWNVNVEINIEEDYYKRDPYQSWVRLPLDRFLLLNTSESNNALYYGKAYATGTIGVFGSPDNLDITVNARSQRGTNINFDFFAQRNLDEDDFIEFYVPDSNQQVQRTINYSGVSMNFNFYLTRDAQIRLIFNKLTGDEMDVVGTGNLVLTLDQIGQLTLDGKYTTQVGSRYNFVLGPIRETFFIEEGGTVTWTGDPYRATLNVKAYTEMRANLADMSPELLTNANQTINCYIHLNESLMKPSIAFEIKAPKALEQDKALLNQIATDEDELNKQFFALLLWKKFQPLKGSTRANTGAALDLASSQINSLLSQMSKEYQINVNMTSDAPGKNEYALGIKKGFLDDQLVVSGMFGSRSMTNEAQTQSTFIGDIEVEYKLNKEGTFRINVFNESNDNRTLQSTNRGLNKQGIGVYYRENFNTLNDFKLLQQMLDMVRRKNKKRHPIRRKKQQTRIQ